MTLTCLPGVNSVSLKGPVPSAPVAPYFAPSFLRIARFSIIEYSVANVSGRAASGFFSLSTTVLFGPSLTVIGGQKIAFCPVFGPRKTLKFSATSFAVHGAPDWNFRPLRICSVHVLPSGEIVHDSAIAGTIFPLTSRIIVNSYRA